MKAFSISSDSVDYEIQQALQRYGGNQIESSRIFFTNGQIDPWRANGVNITLTSVTVEDNEPTLFVIGSSHHFWTHPTLPTDSIFIQDARFKIWNQVKIYILYYYYIL